MTDDSPVVAVVGGGFSGAMVAAHLLRMRRKPIQIMLIERGGDIGRGVAYRSQPEAHVLNVPARDMSAYPDRPFHFLEWINTRYSPCHPAGGDDFLPRRIYGAYVQSQLRAAWDARWPGLSLTIVRDEVVSLRLIDERPQIGLARGATISTDCTVLALGNPGPANPPTPFSALYVDARYVAHAWSNDAFHNVRTEDPVLLIGCGLTALDWLVALHARGHRAPIYMLSRRGLLPRMNQPYGAVALSFDPLQGPPTVRELMRRMRAEQRLRESGSDWRAGVDALRPYVQKLWQRWPPEERRRFIRHARPYWEIHRHRAPPSVMNAVNALLTRGQLQVVAGRMQGGALMAEGVTVTVAPRRRNDLISLPPVAWVINCTGPESHARAAQPLIRQMLAEGVAAPDELGLGVRADAAGRLIAGDGYPHGRLYGLGPLLKGVLWETTAVPELRIQARDVANRVCTTLDHDGSRDSETSVRFAY